ncbi:hypothetical protein MKX01_017744 [Papaver californicum]|nr:hypothetical protein MKX01_017744 [Papaver californicum]
MALIFPPNSTVYSSSSNTKFYIYSSQNSNPDFNFKKRIYRDYDYDSENLESPWEGAVIYKRNPSRLGFGEVSTDASKSMASKMGLRVTKSISTDVTRKKHRLRLSGVIKTVLGLSCNRCGGPAAKGVFSNFTILLDEEPVEEPDVIDMGVIFGEQRSSKASSSLNEGEADDYEDALIDLDDRLYFPPEDREIGISKNIRDLVHIEITINAICDANCKGICLKMWYQSQHW